MRPATFARVAVTALAISAALAACASRRDMGALDFAVAPQPVKPVEAAGLYTGVWQVVARTASRRSLRCPADTVEFQRDARGKLIEVDRCREPRRHARAAYGPVRLVDKPVDTRVVTRFRAFTPGRTLWVLDHAADDAWMIAATPDFRTLLILSRAPSTTVAERDRLAARARALGYDVARLEYPEPPEV